MNPFLEETMRIEFVKGLLLKVWIENSRNSGNPLECFDRRIRNFNFRDMIFSCPEVQDEIPFILYNKN